MALQVLVAFLFTVGLGAVPARAQSVIYTVAGGGPRDLPALSTGLSVLVAIARNDSTGDLYLAARNANVVLKVSAATGLVSVVAGTGFNGTFQGDGTPALKAHVGSPTGVAVDPGTGDVLIAAYGRLLRLVIATGVVTSAGGGGNNVISEGAQAADVALFPNAVAIDPGTGDILVGTEYQGRIVRIARGSGLISIIAGGGFTDGDGIPATTAYVAPRALAVNPISGDIVFSEYNQHRVRRVSATSGLITTVAGTGVGGSSEDGIPASSAQLWYPEGVAVDPTTGDTLIAEYLTARVRRVDAASGLIRTMAGSLGGFTQDGIPALQAYILPQGLAVDPASGNVIIAEGSYRARVRKVIAASGLISTVAGNMTDWFGGDGHQATDAQLNWPWAVAVDPTTGDTVIAEFNSGTVRRVSASTGVIQTIAGAGIQLAPDCSYLDGVLATRACFTGLAGVAVDPASGDVVVLDYNSNRVRRIASATGLISTVAGVVNQAGYSGENVPAADSLLDQPISLAIDPASGDIFIGEVPYYSGAARIRRVVSSTGLIHTEVGRGTISDPPDGTSALDVALGTPWNLAIHPATGELYFGDSLVIRRVSGGQVFRVAGGGSLTGEAVPALSAYIPGTYGIAFSPVTTDLILGGAYLVRRLEAATGLIATIAGTGTGGFSGDGGDPLNAEFYSAQGFAVDPITGDILVADTLNNRVRRIHFAASSVDTVITSAPPGLSNSATASFSFDSTVPGSVFQCALDNAAYGSCSSPRIYSGLFDGPHTFLVRAIDPSGHFDTTPASHTWTIDTRVTPGPLDHIALSPDSATISSGGSQSYTAFGFDASGNSLGDVTSSTVFSITPDGSCSGSACTATVGGAHTVTATNNGKTATASLTVNLLGQSISFDPLPDRVFGNAPVAVVATASSGLPVSFGTSGQCTASSAVVTLTGAGSCTVTASQAGDTSYAAAPDVSRTFAIGTASQSITFGALPGRTYGDAPFQVTASASSGLTVSFAANGACTMIGSTVTLTGTGNCTITASQIGDANYFAATDVSQSFPIASAITPGGIITTVAGTGPFGFNGDGILATSAHFFPNKIAIDPSTSDVLIADRLAHRIRRVSAATGLISTVAGTGVAGYNGDGIQAATARIDSPNGVSVDQATGDVLIAEHNGQRVRRVSATTGLISTVAGTGVAGFNGDGIAATSAQVNFPGAAIALPNGDILISEVGGSRVRRVSATTGLITTVAGTGVAGWNGDNIPATTAQFSEPVGLALDPTTEDIIIGTGASNRVLRVNAATGYISTFAGTGTSGFNGDGIAATSALLSQPVGVSFEAATGDLLIVEATGHRVRRVSAASGLISTVAGTGNQGFSGDGGPAANARLSVPTDVVADPATGDVYIADRDNGRVRVVTRAGQTITLGSLPDRTFGDPPFAVSATASSGLAVSFAASGSCTLAGSTVTLTGAGSCTITATQAGNTDLAPASPVAQAFSIGKSPQTISFAALADRPLADSPFGLVATASSGLSVTFAASGNCTVSVSTVSLTASGACTITASQPGSADYLPAADVARTFSVGDSTPPVLSLPGDLTVEATSAAGAAVTFAATATDAVDGLRPVICTPASGETFPLGSTTVNCLASDTQSNTATGSFTVTIRDTTGPVLSLPGDLTVTAPLEPTAVPYTATASDSVDGAVPITCAPAPGATFSIGATTVNCSATDAHGNTATGSFTVTVTASSVTSCIAPPAGLIGWWPGDGSVAHLAGASDAILQGGATFADGLVGQAFSLNGQDAYVNVPDDPSLNVGTRDFTVNVWVKFRDLDGEQILIEKWLQSPEVRGWTLTKLDPTDYRGGNIVFLAVRGAQRYGGDGLLRTGVGVSVDTWHHFAVTRTGDLFSLYWNGMLVDSATLAIDLDAPTPLAIGHRVNSSITFLNGLVDEAQLFDRALAQSEVAAIFIAGGHGQCRPLTAQTILVTQHAPGTSVYGASFTVQASGGESGNPVTIGASGACSGTGNGSASITMTSGTGTCTVTFDQAGDSTHAAASQVVETTAAQKASQTISFATVADRKQSESPFSVAATASSSLPVTFSASGNCTVSASTVSLTAMGPCTITASQAGNADYVPAADVARAFTVLDGTPPVLSLPGNLTVEATSAAGAIVTFSATATDAVDGARPVSCVPASGTAFSVGTRTVSCSATDAQGNSATGSFTVTVQDTTPPTLTLPPNIVREATSSTGAVVSFTATATDKVNGSRPVTCVPASGTRFALGTTTVNCSATDTRGNIATGQFTVTVQDTTPPALTLPAPVVKETTGTGGAAVTYVASATDVVDGAVTVTCAPTSGSTFPRGTTTVNCTARDTRGNTATGSFPVTVTQFTLLHSFTGTDGSGLYAGLLQAGDGNFYGSTYAGGASNKGTLFKMTSGGAVTTLRSLTSQDDVRARLIQASDGNFYGTTYSGGSFGKGSLFRMTSAGVMTTLYSFNSSDGANPIGGLIQASDGNFYGTTTVGGTFNLGTVFKMTAAGAVTTLYSFDSTHSTTPYAGLIQANDGNFYGATAGGTYDVGAIFRMTMAGEVTIMHWFNFSDGALPLGDLIQASDGNIYGTTYRGGSSDLGTSFKMSLTGALTVLHSFHGTDGSNPYAGLTEATDGNFYGVTYSGGASNAGAIFRLTSSGPLTVLHSFSAADGTVPLSGVTQAVDGKLYGVTFYGGTSGPSPHYGMAYRLDLALPVDTSAPPAPTILSAPTPLTNQTSASFGFTESQTGVSFLCQLDGSAFSACTSGKGYTGLAKGIHTFGVKAKDAAGNQSVVASYTWTIDTTAPAKPSITATPANPTTLTSATFAFSNTETGVSFLCQVDGSAFSLCTSPQTYSSLSDGSHTFAVMAQDAAGNQSAAVSYTWTVDSTAPTPTITAKPANPSNQATASFSFSDTEKGVSFLCQLDGGAFSACTSPRTYTGLSQGGHSFSVQAKDALGNVSAAASYAWTIDTTAPPIPTITSTPANPSNLTSASFSFSDAEAAVTYLCQIDGSAFAACTSPKTYTALSKGSHAFAVKVQDAAGNQSSAVSFTWTIDITAPATPTITAKPANPTAQTSASFSFKDTEAGVTFLCQLDGGGFSVCASPQTYSGLGRTSHTFAVKAQDAAGNQSSAASYTWTVQ